MTLDADGTRVGGFVVTKMILTQGKKEDDPGKLTITLEALKDEINCGSYDLGDIIKGINIHQESQTPVVLKLQVTNDAVAR